MTVVVLTQFKKAISSFVATRLASRSACEPMKDTDIKCYDYPSKYVIKSEDWCHTTRKYPNSPDSPHVGEIKCMCKQCAPGISPFFGVPGTRLMTIVKFSLEASILEKTNTMCGVYTAYLLITFPTRWLYCELSHSRKISCFANDWKSGWMGWDESASWTCLYKDTAKLLTMISKGFYNNIQCSVVCILCF